MIGCFPPEWNSLSCHTLWPARQQQTPRRVQFLQSLGTVHCGLSPSVPTGPVGMPERERVRGLARRDALFEACDGEGARGHTAWSLHTSGVSVGAC